MREFVLIFENSVVWSPFEWCWFSYTNLHFAIHRIGWLSSRCCCSYLNKLVHIKCNINRSAQTQLCPYNNVSLCVFVIACIFAALTHSLSLSHTKLLIIFVYDVRFLLHIVIIFSSSMLISSLLSTLTKVCCSFLREKAKTRQRKLPKKIIGFLVNEIQMECFAWCMQFQMHLNRNGCWSSGEKMRVHTYCIVVCVRLFKISAMHVLDVFRIILTKLRPSVGIVRFFPSNLIYLMLIFRVLCAFFSGGQLIGCMRVYVFILCYRIAKSILGTGTHTKSGCCKKVHIKCQRRKDAKVNCRQSFS